MSGFASERPEAPPTPIDTPSYVRGIATGLAIAMALLQLMLALYVIPQGELVVREFETAAVPGIFKLVVSSAWQCGVPAASAALLALVIARRPRPVWPYLALAVALAVAVAVAVSWLGAHAPITALAGAVH
jgi:hypothetical protein